MNASSKTDQLILCESLCKGCCWLSKSAKDENRDAQDGVVLLYKSASFYIQRYKNLQIYKRNYLIISLLISMQIIFLRNDYLIKLLLSLILQNYTIPVFLNQRISKRDSSDILFQEGITLLICAYDPSESID